MINSPDTPHHPLNHNIDQLKRNEVKMILESTEGFKMLSSTQRSIILRSFYLNEGAARNTNLDGEKYARSKRHENEWYCHAAIANLESEDSAGLIHELQMPSSFFEAEYHKTTSHKDLQQIIEAHGFPCVIHKDFMFKNGYRHHAHTCLALGHDINGVIRIWEKEGYNLPYRLQTLEDLYKGIGIDFLWGVRNLRTNKKYTQ